MEKSIEKFRKGTNYVKVESAVTKEHLTPVTEISEEYRKLKCVKFIPASGVATRMFEDLYKYKVDQIETESIRRFFEELEDFAFYKDLSGFMEKEHLQKDVPSNRIRIIEHLLGASGMNYGSLPKALIKMNAYEGYSATPIEEHLYEGERYLNEENSQYHFTISKNHEALFNTFIESVRVGRENIIVTYSFQKPETDTLAVDLENNPFRTEEGQILYRPGGHGALIENLNDLDGDILFIKNIDNVCHRDYVEDTVVAKKALASIGYKTKKRIDGVIEAILQEDYDKSAVEDLICSVLHIDYEGDLTRDKALSFLNRPLRVCGVVRNQGEPGGGPFVVKSKEYSDLQICEKSEIDLKDPEQMEHFKSSAYFNPVDLVCFVRDHRGRKFNLLDFVNEDRYFISRKTYKGKDIQALEYPGLWNGAMDNWNTLFVEVPLSTFHPVKKVNDLLKPCRKGRSAE
ncbi:DUF4301 family protein [Proteiniclasticum sp. SCR006]|uniref:DUF4301 family protein n=1 Tax=Proteiniclasticum aestuarii TaxID=2817862 RepID=A0A939HDB4_9CLOT|nr:DUF4301 family protein [Proteiniclasticum aestuarii]MBO1266313.1 DUF4301 family protein [Proteiniclasticum aestuarii]